MRFDKLKYKLSKFGRNDFGLWITTDLKLVNSGFSVRGTKEEVLKELKDFKKVL